MSESFPRTRKAKTLGQGDSKLVQLWVSAELRALADVVSMRLGQSRSGYMRRALWQALQREATAEELRLYKRDAWGKTG